MSPVPVTAPVSDLPGETRRRLRDSDLWFSFSRSPTVVVATAVAAIMLLGALLAPLIAPQDPFDLSSLSILDAHIPPSWMAGDDHRFLLGSDDQGRDVLSAILYGSRISIGVGFASVTLALVLGVGLGCSPDMPAVASMHGSCERQKSNCRSPPS